MEGSKKIILVTGGAGFIGSHTAKELLIRGNAVIVVDNFNDYYDPSLKEARIKELQKTKQDYLSKSILSQDYSQVQKIN